MRLLSSMFVPMLILAAPAAAQSSPQAALDGLLAAEKSLSEAAASKSPAEGIASVIASDGVLMTPKGPVTGPAAALAALRDNPASAGTGVHWKSIKSGISADGQHGFTIGYLDIDGGDPARAHRRYLAYWVRGDAGWRVAALKQALRQPNEVEVPTQPATLPAKLVEPAPSATAGHRASLIAAEKAFSDRAQKVGLAQAFQENGRPDAIHLAGPTGMAIGLAAIGKNFESQPAGSSPLNWSADNAFVASSGDLGVTIGDIRPNTPPPEGQPKAIPFFTIWYRDDSSQPWRYIAE